MFNEKFERYGNKEEALISEKYNRLFPRPRHEKQPKWIAEVAVVNPRALGKRKNYTHKMEIETSPNMRKWLKLFEIKPHNEPGRYAIPANRLDEFNNKVISITSQKR